jgi:hypothetical protein
MPKNKKQGKQEEDKDFDKMLAEFRAADLATPSNASGTLSTSSSSTGTRLDARPSVTSLPSSALASAAGPYVSEEAIIDACLAGDLAELRRWGRQGVRVSTALPLLQAVRNGASFDVLRCLVKELGANVNQRDNIVALTAAAYLGKYEIVRYLIEKLGADVNILDNDGFTPLYLAASKGHLAAVQVLLSLGADVNSVDEYGATPLNRWPLSISIKRS